MRVAFWQASDDGSSWYRCELPAQALLWRDHKVWCSQLMPDSQIRNADVVVGSRVAQEGPLHVWKQMAQNGKRLILDLDDNYFAIPEDNPAHQPWAGVLQSNLREAISVSSRVVVASPALATVLSDYHSDVVVIPNGLNATLLQEPRDYHKPNPVVGWSGSPASLQEWSEPGFVRALNRVTQLPVKPRVRLVGTHLEAAHTRGLTTSGADAFEWTHHPMHYLARCNEFDLWVAPYRDNLFNSCKFPTKALEAGMLGIPLVVSAIRPYTEWIEHGVNGYLVKHDWEWGKYMKLLVENPELRQAVGQAARERASHNIMQSLGAQWETALSA